LATTVGAAPPAPPAPDFFAAQDAARARARRLLALFALCVVAVVVAMDAYVVLIVAEMDYNHTVQSAPHSLTFGEAIARVPRAVVLAPIAITLALILVGNLERTRELARGSDKLAQSIGARAVALETKDPYERQLRNVVDEMALASGGLPPALYVLDGEAAINAFAGTSAREAFVVVTRGAIERLQRDELQALVAYVVGQLRNGDATLNLRLIVWLAGITVIGDVGREMIKMPWHAIRKAEGNIGDLRKGLMFISLQIAILGVLVAIIGYVGLLLARIVRALASRQRVYLADATAVQYTRDPVAVRDLLRRVESDAAGGRLVGPYKEEFGPMLFVPGVKRLCLRTHPKLRQRIARLEKP
jgi:Zn-dependent protease with chaperone function